MSGFTTGDVVGMLKLMTKQQQRLLHEPVTVIDEDTGTEKQVYGVNSEHGNIRLTTKESE